MSKFTIKNSDGDFFQSQNYILQLLAEKKITQSAFVLYCFYRSLAGFTEIRCGYKFISLNSSLSKGSITNANKILKDLGLIQIQDNGKNNPFSITITSGSLLPRRKLKNVDYSNNSSDSEQPIQTLNTEDDLSSESERININNKYSINKNNTTAEKTINLQKLYKKHKPKAPINQYELLIQRFTDFWKSYYNQKEYYKQDLHAVFNIQEPLDAIKYISVLWSLDEADKWIKKSDHSLSIFVKEYLSGRLQSYYPQTRAYYEDKKEEKEKGG